MEATLRTKADSWERKGGSSNRYGEQERGQSNLDDYLYVK
jgi:hypothetical protein